MGLTVGAQRLGAIVAPPAETRRTLSRKLDVSPQAIAKWLSGESVPNAEHRDAIAEITDGAIPPESWDQDIALDDSVKSTGTEG